MWHVFFLFFFPQWQPTQISSISCLKYARSVMVLLLFFIYILLRFSFRRRVYLPQLNESSPSHSVRGRDKNVTAEHLLRSCIVSVPLIYICWAIIKFGFFPFLVHMCLRIALDIYTIHVCRKILFKVHEWKSETEKMKLIRNFKYRWTVDNHLTCGA